VLEIEFDCAQLKARDLRSKDPEHKWEGFNGDLARLAVRKAQYHWGWDWGPVIMTAGIWRDGRIEVYSARIADLWPQTQLSPDHSTATVTAAADIEAVGSGAYTAAFRLTLRGREIERQDIPVNGKRTARATFQVAQPELWWPNGYGAQTLYEVSVSLVGDGTEKYDEIFKEFGIRSAEVIQQPDKHGKSFYFRINGVDIFCGGSCWIPADGLLPDISADRYWKWVQLMAEGGQTMVRYVSLRPSVFVAILTLVVTESGEVEYTKTTRSTRHATTWAFLFGKTSCLAVAIIRHGPSCVNPYSRRQFITCGDCDTIRQS